MINEDKKPRLMVIGNPDECTDTTLVKKIQELSNTYEIVYCDKDTVIKREDEIIITDNLPKIYDPYVETLIQQDPHIMDCYDDYFHKKVTKKQLKEPDAVPVRNSKNNPKIGRNELCSCGSGKKNKNCCKIY